MDDRPWYIVFAGVNGSGKSTLYRTNLWRTPGMPTSMPRVNPDELLSANGGNASSARDQIQAGKEALALIDSHFAHRRSFNHETTLTGHRALKNLARAHQEGYRVRLFYIGVASEDIAIDRIAHRAALGGHDIEEASVRRRYRASLTNFSKALAWCEEAQVFDNTTAFKCIAVWSKGTLAWWGASKTTGSWLPSAMLDGTVWKRTG